MPLVAVVQGENPSVPETAETESRSRRFFIIRIQHACRDWGESTHTAESNALSLSICPQTPQPFLPPSPASLLKITSQLSRFATLPEQTRARYEHPASSYSFGWSHGKETLEAGKPDLAKGSYYANPCFDSPFADDPAMVARHPALAHPNIWPDSDVAGFSDAFKALGQAVVRVGVLVARQCDR